MTYCLFQRLANVHWQLILPKVKLLIQERTVQRDIPSMTLLTLSIFFTKPTTEREILLFLQHHPIQDTMHKVVQRAFTRKDGSKRSWLFYNSKNIRFIALYALHTRHKAVHQHSFKVWRTGNMSIFVSKNTNGPLHTFQMPQHILWTNKTETFDKKCLRIIWKRWQNGDNSWSASLILLDW